LSNLVVNMDIIITLIAAAATVWNCKQEKYQLAYLSARNAFHTVSRYLHVFSIGQLSSGQMEKCTLAQ